MIGFILVAVGAILCIGSCIIGEKLEIVHPAYGFLKNFAEFNSWLVLLGFILAVGGI